MRPALLVPPCGSTDCILVKMKLILYLSLGLSGSEEMPLSLEKLSVGPMMKMMKCRHCFTLTMGDYMQSADNPSAMGEDWESMAIPQETHTLSRFS